MVTVPFLCVLLVDVTLVCPSGCHQWPNTLIFRSQPVACCRYEPFPVESSLAGQVLTCYHTPFCINCFISRRHSCLQSRARQLSGRYGSLF